MLAEQRKLTLDGHRISYTLRRSDKARYARLEARPQSGLTVVVPAHYGMDRVRALLLKKRRWITSKLDKYGISQRQHQGQLKAGDLLPYLGRSMRIEMRESGDKTGSVSLGEGKLVVCVAQGDRRLHLLLERWYRDQAWSKIVPMLEELSHLMGLHYNTVTFKGQKTLWGSCSRKHNLNFNWRLVMTPRPVIEYVLVHELAHLQEMNHSWRFWQIVEKYCPAWRDHRKWLRDRSRELARLLPA